LPRKASVAEDGFSSRGWVARVGALLEEDFR